MEQIQPYIDLILNQITSTRAFILQILSEKFSTSPEQVQWGILSIIVYLLLVYMGGKIHHILINGARKNLQGYTLTYDTILAQVQTQAYTTNTIDCSWIQTIIQSGSYLQNHTFLLEKLTTIGQSTITSETIKQLHRQLHNYKKTNRLQRCVGRLVTVCTLGIYKIFW